MSHLNAKINSVSPNVNGVFAPPSLQSLPDYSTTPPTDGQVLVYSDTTSKWEAADYVPSGVATYPVAVFGQGESADYATTGLTISTGQVLALYDTSPINNITGSVQFNYIAGTSWLNSVTLSAGKYELMTSAVCKFTSTGYLKYRWQDSGGTKYSSQAIIGEGPTNSEGKSNVLYGHIDTASPVTISLNIDLAFGVAASQGTYIAQSSTLSIRKVL
jgi:hypothetical protein